MKYKLVISAFLLILLAAWIGINHKTFPPPPSNFSIASKTVNLKFKVTNKDMNSVEMALNEGQGSNNLYTLFELSDDWYKGNFSLVLKDMSANSLLRGNSGKQPDIQKFEKDNSGNKVTFYSFDQTLVKDNNGVSYIQMSYVGTPMPLIQSLRIEKNITLPRHISSRFVNNEDIEFQAGEYGIDSQINGFWIPVKIAGK
jgi:hypothetical protein